MYTVKLYDNDGVVSTINADTIYYNNAENSVYLIITCLNKDNIGINFNDFRGAGYTLIEAENEDTVIPFNNFNYCSSVSCMMSEKIVWSLQFSENEGALTVE